MANTENILVIKLGALGDFVQALGPAKAIRGHHPNANITLLTTKPYVEFAKASGLFDAVWIDDERPKIWQVAAVLRLRKRLKLGDFSRVYDLQTSTRSSFYFQILIPSRPEWSGIALACSHPHSNPNRNKMHTLERQKEQLAEAGVHGVEAPDLSWAAVGVDTDKFGLQKPYALLVPGGAAHRPAKRWPADRFSALANNMIATGLTPVLLGARAELGILQMIALDAPGCVNLGAKTDFVDLAALALGAKVAVGNDTGPMHLIAAAGCKSIVLYSHESDPALCAQRGADVEIVRRESLNDLSSDTVWQTVQTSET